MAKSVSSIMKLYKDMPKSKRSVDIIRNMLLVNGYKNFTFHVADDYSTIDLEINDVA